MVFSYFEKLSPRDRRIYRQSDRIADVGLPMPRALASNVAALARALETAERGAVQRAVQSLTNALLDQLAAPHVTVRVLSKRPRRADGELHGLYTCEHDGSQPRIEVWMRTAEHRRVVAFRTFLRTLLHELCHHLDLCHFRLAETFHTEGFFRRESSLFRQLVPRRTASEAQRPQAIDGERERKPSNKRPRRKPAGRAKQLSLFADG
jgi:hypothetical protein